MEDFKGKPIGYRVIYYSTDTEGDIYAVNVSFTSNTTVLINLTVYTVYVINVSALSSGGIGPANTVKARTGAKGTHILILLPMHDSPPGSKNDSSP